MNRYLLHILLILVVMVSCSRQDDQYVDFENPGEEIRFNISVPDVATRGASIINSREDLDGKSVGMFAFMTSSEAPYANELRAENVELKYNKDANTWEYVNLSEPLKWNFENTYDRFSFYVYYPYDQNAKNINFDMDNETFSIDYDAIKDQDVDVMIAQLEDIVCPKGGVITIALKHILSAVTFNTDYTKPIEDVKLCSASSYTKMPKSGTASLSNGVVEWIIDDYYTSEYSYSLGNSSGNYALVVPQTLPNRGDLYFSMSYNDGKNPVDNGAKIPAQMIFDAGQIYTFKYKGSYVDYDQETGDLIIDIDDYNASDVGYNDFSAIGAIIDKVNELAEAEGKDVTLVIKGDLNNSDQAYHMLRYIVEGIIPNTWPQQYRDNLEVHHFDFSGMVMGPGTKFPYRAFDDDEIRKSLKTIKLPLLSDSNFDAAFLDGCTELETIEFAKGSTVTKLLYNFCNGCTSLKNVNLEVLTRLEEISQNAFIGCTALQEVQLPQSVTLIDGTSFKDCESLSQINIPSSVVTIGWNAFLNCKSLYSYEHDGVEAGFVVEPRSDNSLISVGYQSFYQTHVETLIDGKTWWSGVGANDIFSTPN